MGMGRHPGERLGPCISPHFFLSPWQSDSSSMGICLDSVSSPTSLSFSPSISSLSPYVPVPHRTPNSPSQKGKQKREESGVSGIRVPSPQLSQILDGSVETTRGFNTRSQNLQLQPSHSYC